jgi:hypothetical protein
MVILVELEHEALAYCADELEKAPPKDKKVWLEVLHAQTTWLAWARDTLLHEALLPRLDVPGVLGWLLQTQPKYRAELLKVVLTLKTTRRSECLQIMDRLEDVVENLRTVSERVADALQMRSIANTNVQFLKPQDSKN